MPQASVLIKKQHRSPGKGTHFARLLVILALLLALPSAARAQSLSFQLQREIVNAFWNEDGSLSIDYLFVFANDQTGDPIDAVDVGVPTSDYDLGSVYADLNGVPITAIGSSPYVNPGVAVELGSRLIPPGQTGSLHVLIGTVRGVLHRDSQDNAYASAVFSPTWFDSSFVHGSTDLTVTFHLPPGVQPEEPRWHAAPEGFPAEPQAGIDPQGRVTYTWQNPNASGNQQYNFGASFPAKYVPAATIVRPNPFAGIGKVISGLASTLPTLICLAVIAFIIIGAASGDKRRKMQYLPPRIAIEGHGIKRGLTAIEAAILLEEPLDKILTMILFAVIKKGAAEVKTRDPLALTILQPPPADLRPYEAEFLDAFSDSSKSKQKSALQAMMVSLVKDVANKMKGFSRKETIAYYRSIISQAWTQVEAAGTPEVKSAKFDEVMEWTMLDRDYERRTRDTFGPGPVFVPTWWPRYDPIYRGGTASTIPVTSGAPVTGTRGAAGLPHLPGADFAASIVNGVQNVSSGVVGNLAEFTNGVTRVTNPLPPPSTTRSGGSYHSGGGGCACACACACAGCACACAGGGR